MRHQLNVVLLTSVVWTAFLSFAFPSPVESDDEEAAEEVAKGDAAALEEFRAKVKEAGSQSR